MPVFHTASRRIARSVTFSILVAGLAFSVARCATRGATPTPTVNRPNAAENSSAGQAKFAGRITRSPDGESVYRNSMIGFALGFGTDWEVWDRPEKMRTDFRGSVAQLEANGQEVLLAGHLSNIVGCRVTTEKVGIPVEDYAILIMDINKSEVGQVESQTLQVAGKTMVKWEATHPETGLIFVEYVAREGDYNLRITFWTHPGLKERYLPEFQRIAESYRSL
jgi:hypothetical protein